MAISGLLVRTTTAASVTPTLSGGFSFHLPSGGPRPFRLAQIDDYTSHSRSDLRWKAPVSICLRARISASNYAGTWGFGLWNDPFDPSLGIQGTSRHLPALPNAAWFFFASRPNHLSLRDDRPGQGFMAATFASPAVPSLLLAPALFALPLLAWKRASRGLRARLAAIVRGDSQLLDIDPSGWVQYTLTWRRSSVTFYADDRIVFETGIAPQGPLGLVIWMDNQYAAWEPNGSLSFGTLAGESATMEIEDLYAMDALPA